MLRRLLLCTLLCVALSALLPPSSFSVSLLRVRADASAFADDSDDPHWATTDDDDRKPIDLAAAKRDSASVPVSAPSAPVRDLDEEDDAELLADDGQNKHSSATAPTRESASRTTPPRLARHCWALSDTLQRTAQLLNPRGGRGRESLLTVPVVLSVFRRIRGRRSGCSPREGKVCIGQEVWRRHRW